MGDQELTPPQPTRELPVNIEDDMRRSYLDYAMSVNIGRALIINVAFDALLLFGLFSWRAGHRIDSN